MRILLVDFNPFMPPVTPISLGNLGAVLQSLGHDVRILSLGSTSQFSLQSFGRFISDYDPKLVGFGAYQRNIVVVASLARLVKRVLPSVRVVLGGPQAMFLPNKALSSMKAVDYLSRGEGELSMRALVNAVEGGESGLPIPGITSRDRDGDPVTGEPTVPESDLDAYPSPWLSGLLSPMDHEENILLTSRGCPNRCTFCFTPAAFAGPVRHQSVDRVLEDITYVSKRGRGQLWFADPNFSFSESRVVAILEGILRRGLEVRMWIETRADMLTSDLISLMRKAGVRMVAMGLESASPNVFPGLRKGLDPERIREATRAALEAGLDVELFSQYALPGETLDDARKTLQFVKECDVKIRGNTNAQQMQLYFGSEVTAAYETFGIRPLRRRFPPYLSIGTQFETDWMAEREVELIKAAWRAESLDGGKRIVS